MQDEVKGPRTWIMDAVHFLDSITDADATATGRVVASGSHGGIYPAAVASQAGVRAVAFNNAGGGFEGAGVAGVLALAGAGMAAIAADAMSCHIGDARDLVARGKVSTANAVAEALGVRVGMSIAETMTLLQTAPVPHGLLPEIAEARQRHRVSDGPEVELLDSASLVVPDDAGRIVITGSHGGLIGGDPKRALKAPARIAVFNDAGVGRDGIGITRLPALDARGVAAVTVSAASARIGDAGSALETGVISHANASAAEMGAETGLALRDWLRSIR